MLYLNATKGKALNCSRAAAWLGLLQPLLLFPRSFAGEKRKERRKAEGKRKIRSCAPRHPVPGRAMLLRAATGGRCSHRRSQVLGISHQVAAPSRRRLPPGRPV